MPTAALSDSQVLCSYVIVSFTATFLVALMVAGVLGIVHHRADARR